MGGACRRETQGGKEMVKTALSQEEQAVEKWWTMQAEVERG